MADPMIRVEGISKRYRLGTLQAPYGRLSESLASAVSRGFRRSRRQSVDDEKKYIWAVRDVSFDVGEGEVVGIIGQNGAGKTTLLRLLSRITEPTEGMARLNGRVGALLEVGAGLHHELTGRENIFLNGSILGIPHAEIKRRFDEIVAFSELERFLDTPVKRYSSGMFLRLAFAVHAHLEPDILIVDEVLAVGDVSFQKKCMGKMGDVASSGRTVLFVSHNMGAVRALCERGIVLDNGRVTFDGDVSEALGAYLSSVQGSQAGGQVLWSEDEGTAPSAEEIVLRGVRLLSSSGEPREIHEANESIDVEILYELRQPVRGSRFVLAVMTTEGELAFKTTDHDMRPESQEPGLYRSVCTIPGRLLNRRYYRIVLSFSIPGFKQVLPPIDLLTLTVTGAANHGSNFPEKWSGVVSARCDWRLERVSSFEELLTTTQPTSM